jgi:hypothetical protein
MWNLALGHLCFVNEAGREAPFIKKKSSSERIASFVYGKSVISLMP